MPIDADEIFRVCEGLLSNLQRNAREAGQDGHDSLQGHKTVIYIPFLRYVVKGLVKIARH